MFGLRFQLLGTANSRLEEAMQKCFVIMPFGRKLDVVDQKWIDFEAVYDRIICPALAQLNLECIRSDRIAKGSWIHKDMFDLILDAEVCLVDLSTLNPNVMYELGVRHATRRSVTVLMMRNNTPVPYNISHFRSITYDPHDHDSFGATREAIKSFIDAGLRNFNINDSPIHQVVPDIEVKRGRSPILERNTRTTYGVGKTGKKIGFATGNLLGLAHLADVWVNPENTRMEMARPYDRAISATIRYAGAKKNMGGEITDDIINDQLQRLLARDNIRYVQEGTVLATSSGELKRTHGVKWIFHVASAKGTLERGYQPVANLGACVSNLLSEANSPPYELESIRSILIPLMGTGTGQSRLEDTVPKLVEAAVQFLAKKRTPIETVYFLAYTQAEMQALRRVIGSNPQVDAAVETDVEVDGEPLQRS
jgi:O-acetyl-ADP-ribose deacetylase (regulator of RNase III)